MEKNNDKKLVKVVLESYVIRNEEGVGLYRTSTREGAERQLNSFCECYGQPLPFKPSITKERAIVECEVVRRRYPKSRCHGEKAGKTHYRVYVNDVFVKELSFKPHPMALIDAIAPGLDWKINNYNN